MDMIRTFRLIALNKETHRIRDFKYTESYLISGTNGIVNFYDDEFNALSTETIDLNEWSVRAMPNKTSRLGARFKKRPLQTIASLMPIVAAYKYVPVTIPVNIPLGQIDIYKPTITTTKAGYYSVIVNVPTPTISVPAISAYKEG